MKKNNPIKYNNWEPHYDLMKPEDLSSLLHNVSNNKDSLDRVLGIVQKLVHMYKFAKK